MMSHQAEEKLKLSKSSTSIPTKLAGVRIVSPIQGRRRLVLLNLKAKSEWMEKAELTYRRPKMRRVAAARPKL